MSDPVRSTIQRRDADGRIRHGGEWLALWSDPDSLKSAGERRSDAHARHAMSESVAQVLASARSLSGDPSFTPQAMAQTRSVTLDALSRGDLPLAALRGEADAEAAFHRFHDAQVHAEARPTDPDRARLFDLIEQARCEGCAARAYPGLIANLTARHLSRLERADLMNAHLASLVPVAEALRMVLRDSYAALPNASIQTSGFRMWDGWLRARFSDDIARMAATVPDQRAHGAVARAFLDALFAELPTGGRETRRLSPTEPDEAPGPEDHAREETDDPRRAALFAPGDRSDDLHDMTTEGAALRPAPPAPYRIYTTRHDKVVEAASIFPPETLSALRHKLEDKRAAYRREVSRLAGRLQRRLLALQTRDWVFDQEEGLIDAARLDQVIVSPGFTSAFKQETDNPFRDTLVTLLIDNSGSMRGKPIETACITADIVAAALERCSVSTEVLGFTTAAWQGGQSASDWKREGRSPDPGRLNDLLHVIYKDANTPLRRARDVLCAMLSSDLLKENIDGEALTWAARRMLARPETRRLLIVISDGAPVDEATIAQNGDAAILDRHLRQTIRWITQETPIDLVAIGLKHDVDDYYPTAARIDDVEALADTIIRLIDTALTG